MIPDVVYVVRPSETNVPLRYSLRSLANLPHRQVIIAGHCPRWVRNVITVEVRRTTNKYTTVQANLRAALDLKDLTEQIVYFNDDFFVMEPVDKVPVMHRGPAIEYKAVDEQRWRLQKTITELSSLGHDQSTIMSYDGCHVPVPVVVDRAREILRTIPGGVLWRTWYGNILGIGGERVTDVKVRKHEPISGPFMSCAPRSIHSLKHFLEDTLPGGSDYV